MNISAENKNLTQIISINIVEEDYKELLRKELNKIRREANIPGFRIGQVPMSIIEKRFKISVLADKLNNLISDNLYKYIEENKIQTLGQPLPVEDAQKMDLENDSEFTAVFEVGVQPEFDFDLAIIEVEQNTIKISEKFLTAEIEKVKEEYNKFVEEQKKHEETCEDKDHEHEIPNLYDYVFGKDAAKTEEEFQAKFKENLQQSFQRAADMKFSRDAQDALIANVKFDLPDEFLKRWILESKEDKEENITKESIEADYETKYVPGLRLQLIENKIFEKFDVKIERQDLKNYYVDKVLSQYFPPAQTEEEKKRMDDLAESVLKDDNKIIKQLYEGLFDDKMAEILQKNLKVTKKPMDAEKFRKSMEK